MEEETAIHIVRDCYKVRNICEKFVDTSTWNNYLWLKENLLNNKHNSIDSVPWAFGLGPLSEMCGKIEMLKLSTTRPMALTVFVLLIYFQSQYC